jgi:hypothetical protein
VLLAWRASTTAAARKLYAGGFPDAGRSHACFREHRAASTHESWSACGRACRTSPARRCACTTTAAASALYAAGSFGGRRQRPTVPHGAGNGTSWGSGRPGGAAVTSCTSIYFLSAASSSAGGSTSARGGARKSPARRALERHRLASPPARA